MSDAEYTAWLSDLVRSHTNLRYAFVATAEGVVIGRFGDISELACSELTEISEHPESIVAFYQDNLDYEQQGEAFVPRLYSQGPTKAALGRIADGFLVGLFVDMPSEVQTKCNKEKAAWTVGFQSEMRELLKTAPTQNKRLQATLDRRRC